MLPFFSRHWADLLATAGVVVIFAEAVNGRVFVPEELQRWRGWFTSVLAISLGVIWVVWL